MATWFVDQDSIVRRIWGKADTILFIFAGSSAEFALNKSVDWLYFTGRLPADPLGRLFSTVDYSRQIIFSEHEKACYAIDMIASIHKGVEANRGTTIPDEAYLEVLSMLIDYSIRSYELLERKLTAAEKEEVFDVFYRVGQLMNLTKLPASYAEWLVLRQKQLRADLCFGKYTPDLYKQYKKHLGTVRYLVLKQAQILVVPQQINKLLSLGTIPWLRPVVYLYKFFRMLKLENVLKSAILPRAYVKQVKAMDNITIPAN